MAGKNIVVLGGGVGGVVAANELRRRLGGEHRVVLVNRSDQFFFPPGYLWLMVGQRKLSQVSRPLKPLLAGGVELVQEEVLSIDSAAREVTTATQSIAFDHLVIALGAELGPELGPDSMPGFSDVALNVYDADGAHAVLPELERLSQGTVAVVVSSMPYKCPAAPYEAALLADGYLRRKGRRGQVDVVLYTPEPAPLPVAGPVVGQMVKDLLLDRGIEVHFDSGTTSFDPDGRRLLMDSGESQPFDLVLGVPPHKAPSAVASSGLGNQAGWVPVDPGTLETSAADIFAIGDVAAITLPNGKPLPKAGVFASAQALVVADVIAARIAGSDTHERFDGMGWCFLETGDGRAGIASGDFYATPGPHVEMRRPARRWRWGKQTLDHYWMSGGIQGRLAGAALRVGGKLFGMPARL